MPLTRSKLPLYQDPAADVAARVQDLLARMSLDEKIAQLGSCWVFFLLDGKSFSAEKASFFMAQGIGQITRIAGASALKPLESAEVANAIQRYLREQTRLGIPAIVHEECCSGYMALGATIFPQIIGLASTWQPELAEAMTGVIREQMRAVGAHHGLAPVLDVTREPRWGRVEETFGEDPLLASAFGIAYVRGLQGGDFQSGEPAAMPGVLATGKHFLSHGASEGGLNCTPVHIGPRELRETYLMPFEAAIREAGLATVMNAYSEIDGNVVAASRQILTDFLRGELGFKGMVVSDYESIPMINHFHHLAADKVEAAALALHAGVDVELPQTNCYGDPLRSALAEGKVSLEDLDLAVARGLEYKFKLGLFENPFVEVGRVMELFDTPAQRALAHKIARQSLVLLKNEGDLLPLPRTIGSLAVIGPNAQSRRRLLGDYTHPAHIEIMTHFQPAMAEILGFKPDQEEYLPGAIPVSTVFGSICQLVTPETQVMYVEGCPLTEPDRSEFAAAVDAARMADASIVVVGDQAGLVPGCTSGETRDRSNLGLPGVQEELVKAVWETGKPVIVVLVNGRPAAVPWIAEHIPAILEAWLPGEEGGLAVAEAIFGKYSPGGKLPISFPRSVGQVPVFYNHKPSGGRSHFYGDYVDDLASPLYPFGHGLSYTQFTYRDLKISPAQVQAGQQVQITLQVTNSGARAGDEVVQLYLRDVYASVPRPVKELKGFVRLTLQPGESRQIRFDLPVDQLAFYNLEMKLVVEAGTFEVMVGNSSEDIRLRGTLEVVGALVQPIARRVFTCPYWIGE